MVLCLQQLKSMGQVSRSESKYDFSPLRSRDSLTELCFLSLLLYLGKWGTHPLKSVMVPLNWKHCDYDLVTLGTSSSEPGGKERSYYKMRAAGNTVCRALEIH